MSTIFIDEAHSFNILQDVWKHYKNKNFCDVVLIAATDGTRIPAHRLILAAASDYFKDMFNGPYGPLCNYNVEEATLCEVDGSILQTLIEFCYLGRLEISEENVEKLLISANLLHINAVVNACTNFLAAHLHPANCLGITLIAELLNCPTLLEQANSYTLANFMHVYKTDEFLNLNIEKLCSLLASDHLCVSTEEDVFHSIMLWIQHDRPAREKYKDKLLKLVRMSLLKLTFIVNNVKPISTSSDCQHLVKEAIKSHFLPEGKTLNARNQSKSRTTEQLLMTTTIRNDKLHVMYYSQSRKKWMKWSNYLLYRGGCEIALMVDDLYIVGGGRGINYTKTVQRLNLETMTSIEVQPINDCRHMFAVAVLNNFLYVMGGLKDEPISSVERYDPKTNIWGYVAPMKQKRYGFATAELNRKLYAIGGYDSDILSSVECYDPDQNEWKIIAPLKSSRHWPGTAVRHGLLYVVGGWGNNTIECYDPFTNKWTIITHLLRIPNGNCFCTLFHEKLITFFDGHVEECDSATNECKDCVDLKGFHQIHYLFTYSYKLPRNKFLDD